MDSFSINVLVAGFLAALISAPMGCLILWHRLSFLADALGHASILGVALALLANLNIYYGVVFISVVIVFVIVQTQKRHQMPSESILAILSQVGLAGGILLMSQEPDFEHTAHELLFGDILSVSQSDVAVLFVVVAIVLVALRLNWKRLLLISISWEISQAEGISVQKNNLIMYLLMALMVSVLIKVMGVLLIGALLVIPPTAVRWFSVNPEKMVVFTFLFGLLSIFSGFAASASWGTLTAPSIVIAAIIGLLMSQLFKKYRNKH